MPDTPEVTIALWVAAALWVVWWFVPLFVCAVRGPLYANGGDEDPSAAEPDGTDPAYAAAFNQLRERGYEPLGAGWMRLTFNLRLWTYRTKVRAFRHRAAGRFAFLHEQPFAPGWHQVFFATLWDDGGMDLANGGFGEAFTSADGFAAESVPSNDVAAVEVRHAHRVATREANGRRRDPDLSLANLLDATARHAGTSTIGPTAALARSELLPMGGPVALVAGAAALAFGLWNGATPAAVLATLAVLKLILAEKQRRFAAFARARAADGQEEGW